MFDETSTCSSLKFFLLVLLKFELVTGTRNRQGFNQTHQHHLCYTCMEPLIGYTDHSDSCKYLNVSSALASSFVKPCLTADLDSTMEFECRKVVVSYRAVETYLRRDCVPKGLCSWKDRSQSMIETPVSDCVYTDERTQKLECIYCCDTPLCNRTNSSCLSNVLLLGVFILYLCWIKR